MDVTRPLPGTPFTAVKNVEIRLYVTPSTRFACYRGNAKHFFDELLTP